MAPVKPLPRTVIRVPTCPVCGLTATLVVTVKMAPLERVPSLAMTL